MLNTERSQCYRVQCGQFRLPVPGEHVLTPVQRKRMKKKRKAHAHFTEGSCDRCRPGRKKDLNATTAAAGPRNKWSRD